MVRPAPLLSLHRFRQALGSSVSREKGLRLSGAALGDTTGACGEERTCSLRFISQPETPFVLILS